MKMTYKLLFAFALAGTFALFGLGSRASAATITVTTTDDEQWTNPAACSLREAISSANIDGADGSGCVAGSGDDIIIVPAGVYELEDYIEIFAVHEGPSYWPGNITIRGHTGGGTSIRSGANIPMGALFRLIEHQDVQRQITFENIRFINNHNVQHAVRKLSADGSELVLNNVTTDDFLGAALLVDVDDPDVPMGTVTINNSLLQNGGGGIIMGYSVPCAEGSGGLLSVHNSMIRGHNTTTMPGGIGVWCTSLTLDKVTIAHNYSEQSSGGVSIQSYGLSSAPRFEITNTTFAFNTSDQWAGALSIDNFTESWNHGRAHGFIRNSTFADNQGTGGWAGDNQIIAWTSGESFEMSSVLFSQGSSAADACIIFDNNGDAIQLSDGSHNLSYDQSCSGNFIAGNAALMPLADNGGIAPIGAGGLGGNVLTMAFDTEESAAFNTGNSVNCPATDARGVTRPQGTGCDIGAVEMAVSVIDLSLRVYIKPGQPAPRSGQPITLIVEVKNEGTETVHSYDLRGRIPTQFNLHDDVWAEVLGDAVTTVSNPIAPGQTQQTEITYMIKSDASGSVELQFAIGDMRDDEGSVLGAADDLFDLNIVLGLTTTGSRTAAISLIASLIATAGLVIARKRSIYRHRSY